MNRLLLLVLILLLTTVPAVSENYALLAGVGSYLNYPQSTLEGPPNDVRALREVLVQNWGFRRQNVETLIDAQATRRSILDSLRRLRDRVKAGDQVFLYFSGHGTSSYDPKLGRVCLDAGSGCLVPYDAARGAPSLVVDSLLAGRRDLRPILEEIDRKNPAAVFVVFDACYAENSAKAIGSRVTRDLPLHVMTGVDTRDLRFERVDDPPAILPSFKDSDPYPYKNIIFISSSAKDEKALDISTREIDAKEMLTVDGRPHGYFTNVLLRALSGDADLNHDNAISYAEVFQFSAQQTIGMQSPQLKSPQGTAFASKAMFGAESAPKGSGGDPLPSSVRVRLEGSARELQSELRNRPGIQIVPDSADLVVSSRAMNFYLAMGDGLVIRSYRFAEVKELINRIAAEPMVRRFVRGKIPRQRFNATLQFEPQDRGVYRTGEQIKFVMSADRDCYFLLVNIDTAGVATVIYPSRTAAKRGKRIEVTGDVSGPPTGVEYLKLIAFPAMPPNFEGWSGAEFDTRSPRFAQLLRLLERTDAAETSLVLYSAPR